MYAYDDKSLACRVALSKTREEKVSKFSGILNVIVSRDRNCT